MLGLAGARSPPSCCHGLCWLPVGSPGVSAAVSTERPRHGDPRASPSSEDGELQTAEDVQKGSCRATNSFPRHLGITKCFNDFLGELGRHIFVLIKFYPVLREPNVSSLSRTP